MLCINFLVNVESFQNWLVMKRLASAMSRLENPIYNSTRFFRAYLKVRVELKIWHQGWVPVPQSSAFFGCSDSAWAVPVLIRGPVPIHPCLACSIPAPI